MNPIDKRNVGAREPLKRGRPSVGITKKVSLTLTKEEWARIEDSKLTVAAFLKELLSTSPIESESENKITSTETFSAETYQFTKSSVDSRVDMTVKFNLPKDHPYTTEMIDNVRTTIDRSLFNNSNVVSVETKPQYICPFTGKRFGSIDKLVEAAVLKLLEWELARSIRIREKQMEHVRERQAAPKYLDQI
ncbi:hypothetical protein [Paenibacillus sp. IITD108]|uniref:hypothetical protein n=1 Tax=Paenibacillus sp. IITD108 TaxID=3116649 RepID=UPI002F42DE56